MSPTAFGVLGALGPDGTLLAYAHTGDQYMWRRDASRFFTADAPNITGGLPAAMLAHPDAFLEAKPDGPEPSHQLGVRAVTVRQIPDTSKWGGTRTAAPFFAATRHARVLGCAVGLLVGVLGPPAIVGDLGSCPAPVVILPETTDPTALSPGNCLAPPPPMICPSAATTSCTIKTMKPAIRAYRVTNASLIGTAGIAHEIKNPLNFVNNFAALSLELVDELNRRCAGECPYPSCRR